LSVARREEARLEKWDIADVVAFVGEEAVERAGRLGVQRWRELVDEADIAAPEVGERIAAYAVAVADLVEALIERHGVAGLEAAAGLGVDVQPILEGALAVAAGTAP